MCSEDEEVCAYSHDAALCNDSFLVRLHVPSKSPMCTWKKYTVITPSGMTVQNILPACTRYRQSGYGQRSWCTTVELRNLLLRQQASSRSNYQPGPSSDGAAVGAPTRAHRVNDRSAAAFDMDGFEQAVLSFTSQNVHNANVAGGKVAAIAAIAKSDPNGMLRLSPFIRLRDVL